MQRVHTKLVQVFLIIMIVLGSILVIKPTLDQTVNQNCIASLDEKRNIVLSLTAASATASAAITLLPGDTATPIAEKLADFSSYFMIVIIAIYLEKYIVTISSFATFNILFPLICLLLGIYLFTKNKKYVHSAKKILITTLAIYLVVPVSIATSKLIEDTYSKSIEETITLAEESAKKIETNQNDNKWYTKISDKFKSATEYLETILNQFIEAVAIMIVTACLLPLLILVFLYLIIKYLMGIDLKISNDFIRSFQKKSMQE